MDIPIVMAAFGTTTKALETYRYMDGVIRRHLPGRNLYWAFSSRMVKALAEKRHGIGLKSPKQVIEELAQRGHSWAVVQSLHVLWGHEFYRLVDEAACTPVRVSMGLPLLTDFKDFIAVSKALGRIRPAGSQEALVLVGHGTDHPAWTSYLALQHFCREINGPDIFCGAIEGYPDRKSVVEKVVAEGYEKVRLFPFMLVAGTHFREDLTGEDSWKSEFEQRGISVSIEERGLGQLPEIIEIFVDHIRSGLDAAGV